MLSVHEEKIDNNNKTDEIIFDKIKRLEQKNTEEHQRVIDKLEKFEKDLTDNLNKDKKEKENEIEGIKNKISDITKFRWLFVGGLTVAVFVFTNPHIIVDILTPDQVPVNIERVN